MTDPRIGWQGLQQPRDVMPTRQEMAESQRELEKGQGFWDLTKTAVEDQWLASGAMRAIERSRSFDPDPDFSITKEQFQENRQKYGIDAADEMSKSKSSAELTAIQSAYDDDIARQQKLAAYGAEGVAAQAIAGIVDPIGIAAGFLTDGMGFAAKAKSLSRIAKVAAMTGVENAAMEGIMYAGDTQRSLDDVVFAAGTGAIMGGTISALSRAKGGRTVELADEIDQEANTVANDFAEQDLHKARTEVDGEPAFEPTEPNTVFSDNLKAAASEIKEERKGSVGAMKTDPEAVEPVTFDITDTLDEDVVQLENEGLDIDAKVKSGEYMKVSGSRLTRPLQSMYATMMQSANPAFKGLAARLMENPQGNRFAKESASILSHLNNGRIRSAGKNSYNQGFKMYLKEQGVPIKGWLSKSKEDEFHRKIYDYLTGTTKEADPSVKHAAEGMADQFEMGLKIRKEAGEFGFEKVNPDRNYVPVIFDGAKMNTAIQKYGRNAVRNMIANGYTFGKYQLKPKTARKVADMQINRTMDSTLSSRVSFEQVVSASERQRFLDELRAAGVPEEDIEAFALDKELKEMVQSTSARAKKSLGLNVSMSYNGLSVKDVLNTNVPELLENYTRESAGGAAMARMGFDSKQKVLNVIDAAERAGRNSDLSMKAMQEEADELRAAVNLIYGHSIDEGADMSHVKLARRMREMTSLTRLGMLGFAQMPEIGRAISELGLTTVMQSVGSVGSMFKRVKGMKIAEPELREMEELVGFVGEDHLMHSWNVRHDEFGAESDVLNKAGDVMDRALARGTELNSVLSLYRRTQGMLEKVTHRGLSKRLKQHLEGTKSMEPTAMKEAGWDDEFIEQLKEHYNAKPKYEDFNGSKVRTLNIEAMEPEMREKLGVGIARMAGRIIQRNFVGETSKWMNTWVGKMFSQFRTFSIASFEKQLLHDARGNKALLAQRTMAGAFTAGLAYMLRTGVVAAGRDDTQAYLNDKLSDKALAFGTFGMMGQTASLSLAGDVLASFDLMPDEWTGGYGTAGFRPMRGVGDVVPAIGMAEDYGSVLQELSKYAQGDSDLSARQLADKTRRAVPFMNTMAASALIKSTTN